MPHGDADQGIRTPKSTFYDQGRFGRLFPALPGFAADTATVRAALVELGRPGGIMDTNESPTADPFALIVDPTLSVDNPDNPRLTAGMTFLGQFLDHDMTFDPTSSLARTQDPESLRNFRIPALDLDSVYGGGPGVSPHLYDQSVDHGRTTMLVEPNVGSEAVCIDGVQRFDVPRNTQGTALIGDPRNDENLIVDQLHLAFLRFHNRVVSDVRGDLGPLATPGELFAEAQRIVRWHYQWMILHEFLPLTCGDALVADIVANGRRFYDWRNSPYIPVEFSVAAYRFGHSQVRPSYRANFGTSATDRTLQFFAVIFDHTATGTDPADLRGGCRAPRRFIDWQTFFDFGGGQVRKNKRIDTKLSTALFHLLGQPSDEPDSLAIRNLIRGLTMEVPSGQRVAAAMQETPLHESELADLEPFGLHKRTPLWFYVLREADVRADGQHLGPVGGRIVAEVFHGLIDGDPSSYLSQDPDWTPTYGTDDDFGITDLLTAAGVVGALA
ncbi:peroxidase family protein [Cellulomonas xylanilytica]|uniref:Myeloperoxidase n=1 Tax=Cellulomonas xylanilytica TaxID=233583 RepID=A0A510V0J0_9CELL|nr:heme peroxidase family protein [Cellulomonas xylanilytica]GEK20433.1 myeloperoxidase [Cellulomonas xylanilytica]